jgi:hypothetical protein
MAAPYQGQVDTEVVRDGWRVREVVPGPRGFTRAVIVFRRPLRSSSG